MLKRASTYFAREALPGPCCAGSSTAPGWRSWPPTTGSAAPRLPVAARGHRRPRRGPARATRRAASRPRRRPSACDGGRHADPHRPLPRPGSDRPGRPPGERRRVDRWWSGKHAGPRRPRTGHRGPGRLAAVDVGGAARTRARHHRAARRPRGPAAAGLVDRPRPCRAGRPRLRGRTWRTCHAHQAQCGRRLPADQRTVNLLHAATRAPAERGNSLLKTTFKAPRRVSLCPWRIGAITAAPLVLLHHAHGRTT
jgi:hypothetical protein